MQSDFELNLVRNTTDQGWRRTLHILIWLAASTSTFAAQQQTPSERGSARSSLPIGLNARQQPDPFPSTYQAPAAPATAIVNAAILTGTGMSIERGTVLMANGKIVAVGADVPVPADAMIIDANGKWITPGVIDAHSHLGVFPSPGVTGHADGNETVDANTAQVWAEHSIWPQDPGFDRARAGGVTSLLILPGSTNLFGGRSVVVKNVPAATMQAMKFPDAAYGLKMACGENPKGRDGGRGRAPATRMGNIAGFRRAWIEGADYARRWDNYEAKIAKGESAEPPKRDLALDTLAGVLRGEILVQNHCYRADEMAVMVDVAKEFGYRITAFHHATEAYKIPTILAANNICIATWATRWGFKMEAYDGIEENAALLSQAGVCVAMHSDNALLGQRLNLETAVAVSAGRRAGIDIPKAEAVKWFTANPAKMLGILDRTGTLDPGKMADVVLWSADPFSVYAVAEKVFIDGVLVHDSADPRGEHGSDFQLGQPYGAQ